MLNSPLDMDWSMAVGNCLQMLLDCISHRLSLLAPPTRAQRSYSPTTSGGPHVFLAELGGLVLPGIPSRTFWQVIDTVPLDESSKDMFVYFESLYDVIDDMPRPPKSFFRKKAGPGYMDNAIKSNQVTTDAENEVFCDSLEQVEPDQAKRLSAEPSLPLNNAQRVEVEDKNLQRGPGEESLIQSPEAIAGCPAGALGQREVDRQVSNTLQALQRDMKEVMERLSSLESWAALQGRTPMVNPCLPTATHDGKDLPRWPIHLSPPTWCFLLAWPFVVQWLLWYFQRQKR